MTETTWQQDLPPDAQQRREVFARFGLAAYQAQCVERQIGILLATTHNPVFLRTPPEQRDAFFDIEFRKTLGQLVGALRTRVTLSDDLESRLLRAVELRNWLIHHYYWQRGREITSWDGREQMISELQEAADFLGSLDSDLTAIALSWAEALGVSQRELDEEFRRFLSGENA